MKHSLCLAHVIHHDTHRTVATTLILNKMRELIQCLSSIKLTYRLKRLNVKHL